MVDRPDNLTTPRPDNVLANSPSLSDDLTNSFADIQANNERLGLWNDYHEGLLPAGSTPLVTRGGIIRQANNDTQADAVSGIPARYDGNVFDTATRINHLITPYNFAVQSNDAGQAVSTMYPQVDFRKNYEFYAYLNLNTPNVQTPLVLNMGAVSLTKIPRQGLQWNLEGNGYTRSVVNNFNASHFAIRVVYVASGDNYTAEITSYGYPRITFQNAQEFRASFDDSNRPRTGTDEPIEIGTVSGQHADLTPFSADPGVTRVNYMAFDQSIIILPTPETAKMGFRQL